MKKIKKVFRISLVGLVAGAVYNKVTTGDFFDYYRTSSFLAGKLMSVEIPVSWRRTVYGYYVKHFNVNMDDVQDDIESFPNMSSFFTRKLKDSARPWCKTGLVSVFHSF